MSEGTGSSLILDDLGGGRDVILLVDYQCLLVKSCFFGCLETTELLVILLQGDGMTSTLHLMVRKLKTTLAVELDLINI